MMTLYVVPQGGLNCEGATWTASGEANVFTSIQSAVDAACHIDNDEADQ